MSDYFNWFTNHLWHRSSSQAWNPATVTNHDFGSKPVPQGEAEFWGIWGWAAEIICTCVKSTGVPDSFSNAAFILICDLVFQRHVRFQFMCRTYVAPTLFSGCSNLVLQANCDLSVKKCFRRLLLTFVNKFRRSHVDIDIAHRHACMHSIKTCKTCTC